MSAALAGQPTSPAPLGAIPMASRDLADPFEGMPAPSATQPDLGPSLAAAAQMQQQAAPIPAGPFQPTVIPGGKGQPSRIVNKEMSREERGALEALRSNFEAQQDTARREAGLNQQNALAEADAAGEAAVGAAEHARHVGDTLDARDRSIEAAQAQQQAAFDRYRAMDFRDFWADKSTGQKVVAGISLALGALGGALSGQQNLAFETIQNAIRRDFEIQKARIDKAHDDVIMARTGVMDAVEARKVALSDLEVREAAATQATAAKYAAMKARQGVPAAAIAGDKNIQAWRQQEQELMIRAFSSYSRALDVATARSATAGRGGGRRPGMLPPAPKGMDYVTDPKDPQGVARNPDGSPILLPSSAAKAKNAAAAGETKAAAATAKATAEDIAFAHKVDRALGDYETYVRENGRKALVTSEGSRLRSRALLTLSKAPGKSTRWTKEYIEALKESAGLGTRPLLTGAAVDDIAGARRDLRNDFADVMAAKGGAVPRGGRHVRLKSGETGVLAPDGTFTPD